MNNTSITQNPTYCRVNYNPKIVKKLSITAINVNSLISYQKRYDLLELTNKTNSDIILVSETKLNKRHSINFDKFTIIRTDRPASTAGGGTAILIKNNIKFTHIHHPHSAKNKLIEYTIINIDITNNKKLYIISLYATNDGSSAQFIKELENLLRGIRAEAPNVYYLIAGDFNIKSTSFGNTIANHRGISFDKWETNAALQWKFKTYPPNEPTYTNKNSYLDICLADSRLSLSNTTDNDKLVTLHFDSDHKAITFSVDIPNNDNTQIPDDEVPRLNFKATKWKNFKKQLNKTHSWIIPYDRDLTTDEIDKYLKTINEEILSTINKITPKIKNKNNILIYITPRIKKTPKTKITHDIYLQQNF